MMPQTTAALFDALESNIQRIVERAGTCPLCGLPKQGVRLHVGGVVAFDADGHEYISGGRPQSARDAGLCEHPRAFFRAPDRDLHDHELQGSVVVALDLNDNLFRAVEVVTNDGRRVRVTPSTFGLSAITVTVADPDRSVTAEMCEV